MLLTNDPRKSNAVDEVRVDNSDYYIMRECEEKLKQALPELTSYS